MAVCVSQILPPCASGTEGFSKVLTKRWQRTLQGVVRSRTETTTQIHRRRHGDTETQRHRDTVTVTAILVVLVGGGVDGQVMVVGAAAEVAVAGGVALKPSPFGIHQQP